MVAIPSIVLIATMAFLSLFAATISSRTWMKMTALGCAIFEIGAVVFLLITVSH